MIKWFSLRTSLIVGQQKMSQTRADSIFASGNENDSLVYLIAQWLRSIEFCSPVELKAIYMIGHGPPSHRMRRWTVVFDAGSLRHLYTKHCERVVGGLTVVTWALDSHKLSTHYSNSIQIHNVLLGTLYLSALVNCGTLHNRRRITNLQRFLTVYCLWPIILTHRHGLIM